MMNGGLKIFLFLFEGGHIISRTILRRMNQPSLFWDDKSTPLFSSLAEVLKIKLKALLKLLGFLGRCMIPSASCLCLNLLPFLSVSTSNLKSSLDFARCAFCRSTLNIAPKPNGPSSNLFSTRNDEDEAIAKPGNCGSEIPQGGEFHPGDR